MALNLNAIGQEIGPLRREYTWKDVILYAIAVGAGFDELHYCYEKQLKVLPSFPIASMMDFFWQVAEIANINPAGVLHGEQTLAIHKTIPTEGVFITSGQITHIYDKGKNKGALVEAVSDTEDGDGRRLITSGITIFARLDGGFGGHNRPSKSILFPDSQPDIIIKDTPLNNQPLLYRLTGDFFPLHVDPEFAVNSGFDHPVMHGLCTLGFSCRALIKYLTKVATGRNIRRIDCRFSRPLYPGIPIETLIWQISKGKTLWKTVNAQTGEAVITHGVCRYK